MPELAPLLEEALEGLSTSTLMPQNLIDAPRLAYRQEQKVGSKSRSRPSAASSTQPTSTDHPPTQYDPQQPPYAVYPAGTVNPQMMGNLGTPAGYAHESVAGADAEPIYDEEEFENQTYDDETLDQPSDEDMSPPDTSVDPGQPPMLGLDVETGYQPHQNGGDYVP